MSSRRGSERLERSVAEWFINSNAGRDFRRVFCRQIERAQAYDLGVKVLPADCLLAGGEKHNCKTMVTLKMMMDGDVDAVKAGTSEFTTTLHKAAYSGYYGTTKLLLDANADVNEPLEGLDGATPLHCAAYGGHVEIARALLDAQPGWTSKTRTG